MATIGTLPPGTRGFDANTRVTAQQARAFVSAGYKFAVRYVRRSTHHDYDITTGELLGLLNAGLSVMLVQHVASEGWSPTGDLGAAYGAIAAQEAAAAGYPRRCIVWCDLEGTNPTARDADVIAFCNAWYDKVREAGFDAGLYVGYGAGLTADQLYYKLKFRRYWSAYNLNTDSVPSVRGVCMEQLAYPPRTANDHTVQRYMEKYHLSHFDAVSLATRVPGIPFEYDTDIITGDRFNNLPTLIMSGDPG
jgi:hypothetical protein